ncbi:DNA cytosine methyltransferase [Methylophilus sp. OH31]|uniref:DNA cytosine methyltransferase n=1 Tax=Methylophilus sp. OH31 TaxID=1387312 RepID=UPI0009DE6B93|nr:DNA cytosine methyltransferase [Methylophilus sp. OH31]
MSIRDSEAKVSKSPHKNNLNQSDELITIDLFSGSGAVTAALKEAGFQVAVALDNDATACKTYRLNHQEVDLRETDICAVSVKDLPRIPNISLLVVCAPCQPFSLQNQKRNKDPRSKLVLQSVKFITEFSPNLVFFENVPGLASSPEFRKLKRLLSPIGYKLTRVRLFDAADFGVPQRRKRCVVMASKSKSAIKLFNSFTPPGIKATVFDAIGKLPVLKSGEQDSQDALHKARQHKPIVLERLQHIPKDGGSRSSLPEHLQLDCHKRMGETQTYSDVYGRMKWNDVAPTLTTGCTDVTKGRFVHPDQNRAITLREAALLQGFPLKYKFSGNSSSIARQIGNAVPLGLVTQLAPLMKNMISLAKGDIS